MGQRIDDANELEALKEKAHKWDLICKFLDNLPAYQRWLEEQGRGKEEKGS